jgi:hypothetical protein
MALVQHVGLGRARFGVPRPGGVSLASMGDWTALCVGSVVHVLQGRDRVLLLRLRGAPVSAELFSDAATGAVALVVLTSSAQLLERLLVDPTTLHSDSNNTNGTSLKRKGLSASSSSSFSTESVASLSNKRQKQNMEADNQARGGIGVVDEVKGGVGSTPVMTRIDESRMVVMRSLSNGAARSNGGVLKVGPGVFLLRASDSTLSEFTYDSSRSTWVERVWVCNWESCVSCAVATHAGDVDADVSRYVLGSTDGQLAAVPANNNHAVKLLLNSMTGSGDAVISLFAAPQQDHTLEIVSVTAGGRCSTFPVGHPARIHSAQLPHTALSQCQLLRGGNLLYSVRGVAFMVSLGVLSTHTHTHSTSLATRVSSIVPLARLSVPPSPPPSSSSSSSSSSPGVHFLWLGVNGRLYRAVVRRGGSPPSLRSSSAEQDAKAEGSHQSAGELLSTLSLLARRVSELQMRSQKVDEHLGHLSTMVNVKRHFQLSRELFAERWRAANHYATQGRTGRTARSCVFSGIDLQPLLDCTVKLTSVHRSGEHQHGRASHLLNFDVCIVPTSFRKGLTKTVLASPAIRLDPAIVVMQLDVICHSTDPTRSREVHSFFFPMHDSGIVSAQHPWTAASATGVNLHAFARCEVEVRLLDRFSGSLDPARRSVGVAYLDPVLEEDLEASCVVLTPGGGLQFDLLSIATLTNEHKTMSSDPDELRPISMTRLHRSVVRSSEPTALAPCPAVGKGFSFSLSVGFPGLLNPPKDGLYSVENCQNAAASLISIVLSVLEVQDNKTSADEGATNSVKYVGKSGELGVTAVVRCPLLALWLKTSVRGGSADGPAPSSEEGKDAALTISVTPLKPNMKPDNRVDVRVFKLSVQSESIDFS